MERLLAEHQPRAIVNFAAESHVDRSIDGPAAFIQTNVVGTLVLLEAARDYWRSLPGLQSCRIPLSARIDRRGVRLVGGPWALHGEHTPYAPNSPYAASKAASDHLVRAFHHTYGLPVMTTHCSNNYGPYQFPDKLIPLMILKAVAGEPMPVYGDGGNVRDWLYVADHCAAIARVLDAGLVGESYNIGGNAERRNIDVVREICRLVDARVPRADALPRDSQITFVADRPGHDRRYAIDAGKIRRELGWSPTMSFEDGLSRTVDWYLENPEWVRRAQDSGYHGQRLGRWA